MGHIRALGAAKEKEAEEGGGQAPARSRAGSESRSSSSSVSRSRLGSVRNQCDVFSITNEPATEFEGAPAPVPVPVRLCWRMLSVLSLVHCILLIVNVVLLFTVDANERKSHQKTLLFALLMLTNIALLLVLVLTIVRQNRSITQCALCCCFWTSFSYLVILAYNSADDPLAMSAGRTALATVILTLIELIALAAYFALCFIRYKKVVELYNCRACTCDRDCRMGSAPSRLGLSDLWPRSEKVHPGPATAAPAAPASSVAVAPARVSRGASSARRSSSEAPARASPLAESKRFSLPSTHYM